jgi:hypothetical protein
LAVITSLLFGFSERQRAAADCGAAREPGGRDFRPGLIWVKCVYRCSAMLSTAIDNMEPSTMRHQSGGRELASRRRHFAERASHLAFRDARRCTIDDREAGATDIERELGEKATPAYRRN